MRLNSAARFGRPLRSGVTLVELLVVLAIIGILVALLLPAVQSVRESARRASCVNHLRQIALAAQNHVSTFGSFPTGGAISFPRIENYSTNGIPWEAPKTGMGWMYQILPYIEQHQVRSIMDTGELMHVPVPTYFCASRRGARFWDDVALNDYAAATPSPNRYDVDSFWQTYPKNVYQVPYGVQWHGVIVRSTWDEHAEPPRHSTSTPPVRYADILDGTSNTFMVGEKRVAVVNYDGGYWNDDRGWSDGWDSDTIRGTAFGYGSDTMDYDFDRGGFDFGSAHPGGMNTAWADGSVRSISYTVDPQVFNSLADRRDGLAVTAEAY